MNRSREATGGAVMCRAPPARAGSQLAASGQGASPTLKMPRPFSTCLVHASKLHLQDPAPVGGALRLQYLERPAPPIGARVEAAY